MRNFVISISKTAKSKNSDFIVIPQNGQEVAWDDDDSVEEKAPYSDFMNAIDGIGREDLFFGYDSDNKATEKSDYEILSSGFDGVYLDIIDAYEYFE